MVRLAGAADVDTLAALHAQAFPASWSATDFAGLLGQEGAFALLDDHGFILMRAVAGEAEILTLAVRPDARRSGVGKRLVQAGLSHAKRHGAAEAFLEVAADNQAALGLYARAGFKPAGLRRGYYARPGAAPVDGLLLRCDLNSPVT